MGISGLDSGYGDGSGGGDRTVGSIQFTIRESSRNGDQVRRPKITRWALKKGFPGKGRKRLGNTPGAYLRPILINGIGRGVKGHRVDMGSLVIGDRTRAKRVVGIYVQQYFPRPYSDVMVSTAELRGTIRKMCFLFHPQFKFTLAIASNYGWAKMLSNMQN